SFLHVHLLPPHQPRPPFPTRRSSDLGHSSLPVPDNAIYHLADGLGRLEHFQFPFELNNVTRAYYEKLSTVTSGQRGQLFIIGARDRKSTRLNSSHEWISYAVFCFKKK